MDEFNWAQLIGNVGFPIVVAAYLLYRFERKIEKLEKSIIDLSLFVQKDKE